MLKTIGILSLALFGSVAPGAAPMDIVHTADSAGSFRTLVQAVQAAGLTETLEGKGPYTVFAPTDAAFAKLPPGTLETLLQPENRHKLRSILTYHVVAGRLDSAELEHLPSAKTLEGSRVKFAMSEGGLTVDGARVVQADIPTSNGVIYAIDTVLMPPNQ